MNKTMTYGAITGIALFAGLTLPGCFSGSDNTVYGQETERRVPVSTASVRQCTFEERISAQGNVVAKHDAMVSPRIDGVVTGMFVEEGDYVKAHETVLFEIDKETVTQAHEIAVQDRAVASCARKDAEAQVVAAQAQYDKAKLDHERFLRLREQQAITPDAMEQMEAGFKVAEAQLERARTGVTLREQQEKQAEAALAIAKKHLDDSRIVSPLDGWVTFRDKKVGEFAGAGTPILRVADTRVLEVSAFLPGEYYPRIKTGETRLNITVSGIALGELPITYKSAEIQEQLRTFEVKCLVETVPEGVAPGAIAQIDCVLMTRSGLGVPQDVIQVRDGKSCLFVAENGAARLVEVKAGLTTDGWTELVESSLAEGALVITRGGNLVNDGMPISIQEEGK